MITTHQSHNGWQFICSMRSQIIGASYHVYPSERLARQEGEKFLHHFCVGREVADCLLHKHGPHGIDALPDSVKEGIS